ncbi:MAG: RNB domain-containing ribonuclease [Opitutaceae bacterium]
MKLHERLLQLLGRRDYVPLNRAELAAKLGLKKPELRKLDAELQQLLSRGSVVRVKADRFVRPADADLVTGTIQMRPNGRGVLRPEQPDGAPADARAPEPIDVAAEDTGTAMHGDRVVVRLSGGPARPPRGRREQRGSRGAPPVLRSGRVIRILERARDTIVGTLRRSQKFHFVTPDDPRYVHDVYVDAPERSPLVPTPQVGDKVVVRLAEWENRHANPEGEIIEVLGRTFEPRAELAAIYHKYKLETKFPAAVEAEVAALPDAVQPADLEHRLDIRAIPTCTIDPDDAKDFDDALSLEELPDGRVRIGVHIADVGAYVRPGTALDREAQHRGNSTYLVGTVVPMLPFKLSNGLCSLKENEDRLTKSVFFTFNKHGHVTDTEFANTVIRSRKRLTYRQAYALLKENDLEKVRRLPLPPAHQTGATGRPLNSLPTAELRDLQRMIRTFWRFAEPLRAERFRQGALDLDMPETKIFVDADGYADRLERIENDESHQLIEEFMLLANEAVARITRKHQLPSVYRVHDDPDEDRLRDFREFLGTQGVQAGDLTNRRELSRVLAKIRTHDQAQILRVQLLRSLARACYREKPDGHFGLAKKDYTHFTSPIRRYADLVVHRVFETYLVRHCHRPAPRGWKAQYRAEHMPRLAEHLSLTEQNSTEAERESVKVKLLEYFERELKKKKRTPLAATILEVRNHGMFVELVESQAYGFIHVSTLDDDLYTLTPDSTALVGRRKKRRFSLGAQIQVQVDRVDRVKRQIDFRVAQP